MTNKTETNEEFSDEISKYFAKEYMCPGCVCGIDPDRCDKYKKNSKNLSTATYGPGCVNHVAGTSILGLTGILLGFPKGFCRVPEGYQIFSLSVGAYKNIEYSFHEQPDVKYNTFNVPTWKHLDKNGNTLVKGLCPRVNKVFVDVIKGNHLDEINCMEITNDMIEGMD